MDGNTIHPRPRGRLLQLVLLLGAAAFIFGNLLTSLKRSRRDRRQQIQAVQTWEGEGGALKDADDGVGGAVAGSALPSAAPLRYGNAPPSSP